MSHRLPLADIQFISDFAVFARSKGDEGYDFHANYNCACSQFLKASGKAAKPCCGETFWFDRAGPNRGESADIPLTLQPALKVEPHTFSALADRLELLISDAPMVRL